MPAIEPLTPSGRCKVLLALLIASIALFGCPAPETEDGTSDAGAGGQPVSQDKLPPSTPTGLSATIITPTQVNLNWSASGDNVGVTGYRLYRNGAFLTTVGNVTTYQNSGLVPSTTYSYTVQAIDGAGNASGQSTAVIVTTPAAPDTTAPTAPTGLTANAASTSQVNLTWTASTDNVAVTGYRVFQNGALLATLGNITTFQDTFLDAGVTYIYTVRAFDAAGNVSALSTAASATTLTMPDTTAPTIPDNLAAVGATDSQVNLSWLPSTDNVAVSGYRVYRGGVLVAILPSVTMHQDTGLTASTTYSYNVDAIDAAGNVSGLSAAASAITLSAPDTSAPSTRTGVVANAVSPFQINVSWSASTDNVAVTGYRITRSGALIATVGNVTSYQDTGLSASTTYTYRVRALDGAGNVSGLSTAVSATTPAAPDTTAPTTPTGLAANAISDARIALNWSASTDNVAVTGYRVYRNGGFLIALGNVTAYEDSGLSPSTMYSYNVDAIDAVGNASGTSTAAGATTLAVNTATLAWDGVAAANLGGYRVYYGTAPGTYLQPAGGGEPVAANVTTFTVTGLSRGTRYYFAVTAFDTSNNESDYSNEIFKVIP